MITLISLGRAYQPFAHLNGLVIAKFACVCSISDRELVRRERSLIARSARRSGILLATAQCEIDTVALV